MKMKIKKVNEFFDIDNVDDRETTLTSNDRYNHFVEQLNYVIKNALNHLDPEEVKQALKEVSENIEE